jgi:hypothetical protein
LITLNSHIGQMNKLTSQIEYYVLGSGSLRDYSQDSTSSRRKA